MYGKIFDSIYDGTLYGNWEAIATFQQFIVLATPDGIVDMTPQAIAARTSFPLDLIQRGIKFLEAPDPYSRTPGDDGKRLVLLDEHRPWGWRIVNHGKYKRLRHIEEKREADRKRIAEKRSQNKHVAIASQNVANVAYSDTDTDSDTRRTSSPEARSEPAVEKLPLRDGSEYEVSKSLVAELEPLYPNVDVPATLKEMRGWLLLNKDRRKSRRGMGRFISQWLQSEQEKHGS